MVFCIGTLGGLCFTAKAQSGKVSLSGMVYGEDKVALSSVSIDVPQLKLKTKTDENGRFDLSNVPLGQLLLDISFLGYQRLRTQIDVNANNPFFSFTLSRDTVILEGASVFGYTTVQQANRQAYNVVAVDAEKLHNTTLDIAHVLDRVPGARLRETGGLGSDFSFSLNGFSGSQVRFFLDGVPMDNFGSSFQINNIPVNMAQRIEVYKGVVPIWLGSDALGGAVNIITDRTLRNYLDVSYSYGSFNTHQSHINAGFTSKNGWALRLNAFQNYSDNDYTVTVDAADILTGKYYPDTKVKRFHDKYHNETVIAKVGVVDRGWADELLLGLTLGKNYNEIQTGASMTAVYGAWHRRGSIVMPSLKYGKKDLFVSNLDVTVNASYNLGNEQSIDTVNARYGWLGDRITYSGKGGELWYSLYDYRNNNAQANATATYQWGTQHFLALNSTYSHFDRRGNNRVSPSENQNRIPQKTSKNITGISYQYRANAQWETSIFAKYSLQKANTTLVSTRLDNPLDTIYTDVSAHRNKWGYGLASSYFVKPEWQIKFSYEKTNRMPESEDIFGDLINKEGNWNIRPESSDNINLGMSYTLPWSDHRFHFSTTGIYYYAKDFIYYVFNNVENKLVANNLMNVSNIGVESELRYSYQRRFTAGASVTYQNIRDRQPYRTDVPVDLQIESNTYKERIPNIPYLFGNADATVFFHDVLEQKDQLSVAYNMLYVHEFYLYWAKQGAASTKRTIPRQLSHDINIVYALKEGRYNISLECRNVADSKLYDNFSLQKPGRAFYLKLRYFIR